MKKTQLIAVKRKFFIQSFWFAFESKQYEIQFSARHPNPNNISAPARLSYRSFIP